MTISNEEIREEVNLLYQRIGETFTPEFFVLNTVIKDCQDKITQLQKKCTHEFENGVCKYCDFEENN